MPISVLFMDIFPKDPLERKSYLMGLQIAGDFGIVIALPIVLFVIIGQWAERKYGFAPWGTILAFALAALISGKLIYDKSKKYGEEYKRLFFKKTKTPSPTDKKANDTPQSKNTI